MNPAAAPQVDCANCGAALVDAPPARYCARCGQAVAARAEDWRAQARATVARYVRSFRLLLLHPGCLTLEHIADRRARYLTPLRLYLTASFLFFFLVKGLGLTGPTHIEIVTGIDAHGHKITATDSPEAYRELMAETHACVERPGHCGWWRTQVARVQLKADAQAGHADAVVQRMVGMAPNAVFALLPVFAACTMLAYRRRRLPYGMHLAFSLHVHAYWFLALLILTPLPGPPAAVVALALPAYGTWALHRVYRGRWWATALRAIGITVLYVGVLFFTLQVIGVASLVLA